MRGSTWLLSFDNNVSQFLLFVSAYWVGRVSAYRVGEISAHGVGGVSVYGVVMNLFLLK